MIRPERLGDLGPVGLGRRQWVNERGLAARVGGWLNAHDGTLHGLGNRVQGWVLGVPDRLEEHRAQLRGVVAGLPDRVAEGWSEAAERVVEGLHQGLTMEVSFVEGFSKQVASDASFGSMEPALDRRMERHPYPVPFGLGRGVAQVVGAVLAAQEFSGGASLMRSGALATVPAGGLTGGAAATLTVGAMVGGGVMMGHAAGVGVGISRTFGDNARQTWAVMAEGKGGGRPSFLPQDAEGRPLPLPKGPHGEPLPSSRHPHTQLGWREGRKGGYPQTREFGMNGKPVKQVDWTDHGRPTQHADPHVHDYLPNPTGGMHQLGPARAPNAGELK